MSSSFRVQVSKDYLVFASAHFITFRGHQCETLHGHNYRVGVAVEGSLDSETLFVLDFSVLKQITRRLVDEIDHKILLPKLNSKLAYREEGDRLAVDYFGEPTYVFPKRDCALLPIQNTTAEMLAQYLGHRGARRADQERLPAPHADGDGSRRELRPVGDLPRGAGARLIARRGGRSHVRGAQPPAVKGGSDQNGIAPGIANPLQILSAPHPSSNQQANRRTASAQIRQQGDVYAGATTHLPHVEHQHGTRAGPGGPLGQVGRGQLADTGLQRGMQDRPAVPEVETEHHAAAAHCRDEMGQVVERTQRLETDDELSDAECHQFSRARPVAHPGVDHQHHRRGVADQAREQRLLQPSPWIASRSAT